MSAKPTIAEACKVWGIIGLLSFGGPAGQISLMHRYLVDKHRWLTETQYLNALSFCMLLPGPEAMQLATYSGWKLHGVRGGLLAGLLFVLPGAIVVLILAILYALYGHMPLFEAAFLGVKAAVVVIVIEALLRVAKRALKTQAAWVMAIVAFIALFFFNLSFPLVVLMAAIVGYAFSSLFVAENSKTSDALEVSDSGDETPAAASTWATVGVLLLLWALPILIVYALLPDPFLYQLSVFFSKLAVVTFGGAYAVLAYLAQDVVTNFGWMSADAMMDGLGLAETTPGPLILVNEFVGFVSGFNQGGMLYGVLAAALTLWVTFVPCFIWIFAGAPHLERITAMPKLRGALAAITASVVGVILNLSLWFAMHVFFGEVTQHQSGPLTLWAPEFGSLNLIAVGLTALSAFTLFRLHWNVPLMLTVAAAVAVIASYLPL